MLKKHIRNSLLFILVFILVSATCNVSAEPAAPVKKIPGVKYILGPLDYDFVENFHEGMAKVCKDSKYGYIDLAGKEVVKPQYGFADNFSEGLAAVSNDELKKGFIDKLGRVVIDFKFGFTSGFHEGLAAVDVNYNNWGYIDKTGKLVIDPKYGLANDFHEGMAAVGIKKEGYRFPDKYGYINSKGEEIIKPQYRDAQPFFNGLALVFNENEYIYINKQGIKVRKYVYKQTPEFHDGLAQVSDGTKVTFIDITGKTIIKLQNIYDSIGNFSEGLAAVEKNGKYGYIDKTGTEVIPLGFESAGGFCEGLAQVKINGKTYFISSPLDIPDSWAKESVNTAIDKQIVPLYMQYGYKQNITRNDFVTLLVNLIKDKTGNLDSFLTEKNIDIQNNPFNDTSNTNAIIAYKLGIAGGVGYGNFNPDGEITRQEAAVMLAKTAKVLGVDTSNASSPGFSDNVTIKDWAKASVGFVSSKSVMTGIAGNRFDPAGKLIKEQAFAIIIRLLKIL